MAKLHIFLGEEGSGKTTCAAMNSMRFAMHEKLTLLNSIDKYKSLENIFQVVAGKKGIKILSNLMITETDLNKKNKEQLSSVHKNMKHAPHYNTSIDASNHYDLLQFAPGLEEHSTLLVIQKALLSELYDEIVIDTLSINMTMKALALPKVILYWLNMLISVRSELIAKQNQLAALKDSVSSIENDKVYETLLKMKEQYIVLHRMLNDKAVTEFILVINKDSMSLEEAVSIKEGLEISGLSIGRVVLNKCNPESTWPDQVAAKFPDATIEIISSYSRPIEGIEQLSKFSQQIYNYIRA